MRYIQKFSTSGAVQEALENTLLGKPYVAFVEDGQYIDWNSKDVPVLPYDEQYLTIEAVEAGNFYIRNASIYYSVNEGLWQQTTGETTLSLAQGDKVRFKGTGGEKCKSLFSGNTSIAFKAYGNIESLEYLDSFSGQTTMRFASAFTSCFQSSSLIDAANLVLPATSIKEYCYTDMFNSCEFEHAPALPATTLAKYCYLRIFKDCTHLVTPPVLPATNLASSCYSSMFNGCTSLEVAPALPATTLVGEWCYSTMFRNTSIRTAPELPATTLVPRCYQSMFEGCTQLTESPVLPARTLGRVNDCYGYMFKGCTNLNTITCLATNTSSSYYSNWVRGVSLTGTFYKASNVTWPTGVSGIPDGWTVIDADI